MEPADTTLPLPAAIDGFLTVLRAGKPAPNTVRAYRADLATVSERLPGPTGDDGHDGHDGTTPTVADLTARNLRHAFATLADDHSAASVLRAWSTWNRFCDHLVVEGASPGNPMAAVPRARARRTPPRAFTEDDMDRLVDVLVTGRIPGRNPWPTRDLAIIATLATTGLRAAEFLALTFADVEGTSGQRQIIVRSGKGGKWRAIPVSPDLERILTAYVADRRSRGGDIGDGVDPWTWAPETPLWVDGNGHPMTVGQLEHLVRRAYRAAGINTHRARGALIHALRHTFATRLVENGVTAVDLMTLLGHASLQTTQRYVATRPDHLRDAVKANPSLRRATRSPGASRS